MDPSRLMTRTATITSVAMTGTVDVYGNPTESTTTTTARCWLHQSQTDEDTAQQQLSNERWSAYFPAGTTLDANDRVTVDSVAYEVDGPPWPATNPRTGRASHVQATLRKAG